MIDRDLKAENDKFRQLMTMAKLGWWEADFTSREYVCSDFVADLLGLEGGNTISFYAFQGLIRRDYRIRISNEFLSIQDQEVYEQTFPISSKYGEVWVHSKLNQKEKDMDGNITALGFLQCVDNPEKVSTGEVALHRINNLLYQQNSISRTLLSFMQIEDMTEVIHKILKDILMQYDAGRAYIFEFNFEEGMQSCTYEVTKDDVSREKESLQQLPITSTSWWCEQLLMRKPIILFSLDDMPPEAEEDYVVLKAQHIKSLMVVPMVYKDGVWGYMGIDVVDTYRDWTNEDYQWLASLANIISICMSLRKSELKAKEEQRYLESLYKYMPVGYIHVRMLFDEEGNPYDYEFTDINSSGLEILNCNASDYVGKRASSLGIDVKKRIAVLAELLYTKEHKEINFRLDGSNKYCHSVAYSPQGNDIVIMFSDMTETFAAHEALDRSERILRNIYKNLPVGIELYDKDGYLVDMNDKDLEIFGVKTKEDTLGVNISDNPNIPPMVVERIFRKEALDFTLKYDFEKTKNYYNCVSHGNIDLITKVAPLYDSQNNFINYLFINIDNTETTNAYSRIQEFESFFTLVGEYAKVGYAHFDALTRDGYALSSWYRNVGEQEGTPLTDIIGVHAHFHPEDREIMLAFLEKVKSGEESMLRHDMRIMREDGHYTWTRVNVIVKNYRPEEGFIEMVCINYDITELKETEYKLIEAKNKAETLDKLKSAFLANMSHEIRTPLNAIVGFSNLLVDTENIEERRQYISIVQENNELLLQLISDILDLSKMEAGTFEFVKGYVDVNQLCSEIVRSMSMKATELVTIEFDEHLPECYIYGDKNRLIQVITNFINNALKFTSKGSIKVGYQRISDTELKFYVRDTGIGISADKVGTIFDRFVKLNSFVHGTGLGLSICKSLVEQMNGEIGVDSEVGKGSCFWFTHPYNEDLLEHHAADSQDDVASGMLSTVAFTGKEKPLLLIAEDTDSNYILMSSILRKEYELVRALNGGEAVELFHKLKPSLILMDVKMPEMDGIEATREIRKTDKKVPIIAVTAFAFDQDRQRTINAGCDDYVSKPVSTQLLKDTIKKWLDHSKG